jgi:hypothetical protein
MVTKRPSPDQYSTRPLLDKLGVKPGSKVAIVNLDDSRFIKLLRGRTADVVVGKPRSKCDLVFVGADTAADLRKLDEVKLWIEPNGAIWVVRPKGGRSELRDTDLIAAGLAAGLVDNKIASFSETHGAMRFVYRLRDRPK